MQHEAGHKFQCLMLCFTLYAEYCLAILKPPPSFSLLAASTCGQCIASLLQHTCWVFDGLQAEMYRSNGARTVDKTACYIKETAQPWILCKSWTANLRHYSCYGSYVTGKAPPRLLSV